MTKASVIICTHNPKPNYLRRVLDALQRQTLPTELWELVLVDNASNEALAAKCDLSWHANARHVREDDLGLAPARLRGIEESTGDLLIFVDDDNVLAEDYLSATVEISAQKPHIGAFGGSVKGEFETPPPEWLAPYIPWMVVSEIDRDYWANMPAWSDAVPYGAGMCVRRTVAQSYLRNIKINPKRKTLGRCGTTLAGCEDTDMAFCAVDLGMGTGRFARLKLTHLIPKERLTPEYITRLTAGSTASMILLQWFRGIPRLRVRPFWEEAPARIWFLLRASAIDRSVWLATRKAQKEAMLLLETWSRSQTIEAQRGQYSCSSQ